MDIRKIKKLIQLTQDFCIIKLEVSEGNKTIRITRSVSDKISRTSDLSINKELDTLECEQHTATPHNSQNIEKSIHEHIIRAPMVGILYLAPHINSQPFVSVGKFVKIGDTVCIIEAMKIMNQIQSDVAGTIKSILRENGQPIEFDEPLFIIYN